MYFALVMSDTIGEIQGFDDEAELDEFAIERTSFTTEEQAERKAKGNTYGPSVVFALIADNLDQLQENNYKRPVAIYLRGERYDCVKRKPTKKCASLLTDAQKLTWFKKFRPQFDEWVEAPTQRMIAVVDKEALAMPAFIWLACAIDWLAGFWYGGSQGNVKQAYVGFISAYFPPKYDAIELYDSLRNGLVHSYTIKNKKYGLTHHEPENHFRSNENGTVVLNLEDLFQDWRLAKNAYFDAVENDPELLEKAFNQYCLEGFLNHIPVNYL